MQYKHLVYEWFSGGMSVKDDGGTDTKTVVKVPLDHAHAS